MTLLVLVSRDKAAGAEVLDGGFTLGEDVTVVGVDLDGTVALIPLDAEVLRPHPVVRDTDSICLFGRARVLASPGGASLEIATTTVELVLDGSDLNLFKGSLKMSVDE